LVRVVNTLSGTAMAAGGSRAICALLAGSAFPQGVERPTRPCSFCLLLLFIYASRGNERVWLVRLVLRVLVQCC